MVLARTRVYALEVDDTSWKQRPKG
jgi:hypothetical protein